VTREVAPVAILAGAKAWVKAADAPRFLQKLSAWLADRGWEKAAAWSRSWASEEGGWVEWRAQVWREA
jgi:hypothetical protein